METTDVIQNISYLLRENTLNSMMQYGITLCKNIIVAIIIYFLGKFIISKVLLLLRKIMNKRNIEPSLFSFLNSLVTICLYFVLGIAIIGVLGIETSSFVALFASAGVAIGMALSGTLQNFAGGVMILLFKPFRVGHTIEAQGYIGTVQQIQIFNTVLLTVDNQTIIIPNGGLSTGSMKNYSAQSTRRVDINVEVAYGTKPEDVRKILFDICNGDKRILNTDKCKTTAPMISMAASAIVIQLRAWTASADYWNVMAETTEKIYNALNEAGIEIPYQQLDVHMR